jgi:NCAIR mutase (PurE)-related protein
MFGLQRSGMDTERVMRLLAEVASGRLAVEDAARELERLPFAELRAEGPAAQGAPAAPGSHTTASAGERVDARVDHHRELRTGFGEVIFAQGKTPAQVRSISREILENGDVLLATRASASHFQAVAQFAADARYFEDARLIVVDRRVDRPAVGHIVVATGGTADVPVAEEAAVSSEVMGNRVTRLFDVGVAGIHRLLAFRDTLADANVIIAVAGMEGALPSLVAGLVAVPVVAVPTSIGYGAHFGGVAPLLTMLNSCASGIGVVNIDNGFGAAALASRINQAAAGVDRFAAARSDSPATDGASPSSPDEAPE